MRYLQKNKNKITKTYLVISDIHLGAGAFIKGRRNFLEDFHYDKEMVEFLTFHSTGDYQSREVELIINGDFFDMLSVPFVEYFDDEYWSEKASLEKLKMILDAHPEVVEALFTFLAGKNKRIVYVVGNHDAEFAFESLRQHFIDRIPEEHRDRFSFHLGPEEYVPYEGILVKHGHEYEIAHQFDLNKSVVEDEQGVKYFLAPWGSYYVTRILNKFKEERDHINAVKPIRKLLIYGLIYDTLFTLRFIFATSYYFIMVRALYFFKQEKKIKTVLEYSAKELELFRDYETLTEEFLRTRPDVKALIVGHTHDATYRSFAEGAVFVNTGTWTKMHFLDFDKQRSGALLTYAKIDVREKAEDPDDKLDIILNIWKGKTDLPFREFIL